MKATRKKYYKNKLKQRQKQTYRGGSGRGQLLQGKLPPISKTNKHYNPPKLSPIGKINFNITEPSKLNDSKRVYSPPKIKTVVKGTHLLLFNKNNKLMAGIVIKKKFDAYEDPNIPDFIDLDYFITKKNNKNVYTNNFEFLYVDKSFLNVDSTIRNFYTNIRTAIIFDDIMEQSLHYYGKYSNPESREYILAQFDSNDDKTTINNIYSEIRFRMPVEKLYPFYNNSFQKIINTESSNPPIYDKPVKVFSIRGKNLDVKITENTTSHTIPELRKPSSDSDYGIARLFQIDNEEEVNNDVFEIKQPVKPAGPPPSKTRKFRSRGTSTQVNEQPIQILTAERPTATRRLTPQERRRQLLEQRDLQSP